MRVADLTEFYAPTGGVRNHLNTKGRVMRGAGHAHLVIAPGKRHFSGQLEPAAPDAPGSARVLQLAGPTLPYDANYQLLWRLGGVRRALNEFQPDVLSLNSMYMSTLALALLPRRNAPLRTIFWHADFIDTYLRSRLPERVPERVGDALFEPFWAAVRRVTNGSAATFAASRNQVDKLRAHGVERVQFVPFGIDRALFHRERRDSALRAELLGAAPSARLLIGVGRLAGEKRWDVVIDAVQALGRSVPVRLVIFGEGPELERLRAQADPNVVSLPGPLRDRERLASAMASGDLFVHGGAYETYGFSVAEAMASGLPVVVPNSGAVLDLIDPSSSETFVPGSSDSCRAALERVLVPDYARYRAAALSAASAVPDSNRQILALLAAYGELLAQRSPAAS